MNNYSCNLDYIAHYGVPHGHGPNGGSGRYPWGSGAKNGKGLLGSLFKKKTTNSSSHPSQNQQSTTPRQTRPSIPQSEEERKKYINQELNSGDINRIMAVAYDPDVNYGQLKNAIDKSKLIKSTIKEANPTTVDNMDKCMNNLDKVLKYYRTGKELASMGKDIVKITKSVLDIVDEFAK